MTTRRELLRAGLGGAALACLPPLASRSAQAQDSRPVASEQPLLIYAVRHAEKAAGSDPELTLEGTARAAALARLLEHVPLRGVYSTDTKRTRATVAPAAAGHGLEIQSYAPGQLARRLAGAGGGAALVVGHSNTIPALLASFGVEPPEKLMSGYEDLFLLIAWPGQPALLQRLTYGAKSTAQGH